MSAATTPAVSAAARARRQATAVAAVGAIVPTILAAQGMTYLAVDLLGFPLVAAVALAGFLELALVASALLARAAALVGRPGGVDVLAVWVVSATSGLLAGVHELMSTGPTGTTWSADPGTALAAAVRLVAPLVAAWLWERVLQAARAEQAERTLAEVRRDRRLLDVARAALVVRRLDEAGQSASRRARRAARRLDRAHVAALRVAPPPDNLADVLAAVGQVDHLPAATTVEPLAERTADVVTDEAPSTAGLSLTERTADVVTDEAPSAGDVFSGARIVDDYVEEVDVADRTAHGRQPVLAAATTPTTVTAAVPGGETSATLALAVEVVQADPMVSGASLAEELTRRGRPVSTRSGQRWRARALAAMAEASAT